MSTVCSWGFPHCEHKALQIEVLMLIMARHHRFSDLSKQGFSEGIGM